MNRPSGSSSTWAMLGLFPDGRERTETECGALLSKATLWSTPLCVSTGFALRRVVPTSAGISILEAAPVAR